MTDRIRILLVDDNPEFTWDDTHERIFLPAPLAHHFELIWIQDASEARWLLDAFEILSMRAPGKLLEVGFPPEILIFDYALTHSPPRLRSVSDDTYRIAWIQNLAAEYKIELSAARPQDLPVPPDTGADRGEDRTGCYIGGEFARVFSAHPCGSVPTTAHVVTANTDAAFYEWLNEGFFLDFFKYKSRTRPKWDNLLPLAAECLQERIVQLAATGIIRVDLHALQEIVGDAADSTQETVIIHSRFGRRALPVQGLFINHFYRGRGKEKEFAPVAKKWACRVLEALFAGRGQNAFNAGKRLAEQYWTAYLSEERCDRYYLSELLAKAKRTASHEDDIDEICGRLGLNADTARKLPEATSLPAQVSMPNWKTAAPNDEVARWAALMLCVRMEQEWSGAYENQPHAAASPGSRVDKYLAKNRAFRTVRGRKKHVARAATVEDILDALDPLPQDLFTFRQKRRSRTGIVKDTTVLTNPLKHLGRADNSWGTLGLNLADVLADQPFDCEGCQQAIDKDEAPSEHKETPWRSRHHGIRKGEGLLLQIYADEIGFPEAKWPVWLRNAP